MGIAFQTAGVKVTNPFVVDLDPNAVAPVAARIAELPDRTDNGKLTADARFHFEFTNVSAGTPTVDANIWVNDEKSGRWAKVTKLSGMEDGDFRVVSGVGPGRLFVQFVSVPGGTVDSVEAFVAPR